MEDYYKEMEPPATGNRRDVAVVKGYSGSFDDSTANQNQTNDYQIKMKKSKSVPNADRVESRSWSFSDPESRRKRRVAGYKVYSVEQKMKGSIRKSFKWFKDIIDEELTGAQIIGSKAGRSAMSMAGCFADPVINMLVGLSSALVIQTANVYTDAYKLGFHFRKVRYIGDGGKIHVKSK